MPAFLVAIHWRKLAAGPTLLGLVVGTTFSVGFTFWGVSRVGGVHIGILGLGLNAAIAVLGSLWGKPAAASEVRPAAA